MATFINYALSSFADAAAAAYNALNLSGIFDSVSFDSANSIITCTKGSDTATIKYTNSQIEYKLGALDMIATDLNLSSQGFWVGKTANGVLLSFGGYNAAEKGLYTLAVLKARNGLPMMIFRNAANQEVKISATDTEILDTRTETPEVSTYFSALCGICVGNGSVYAVSVAGNAGRYVYRMAGVPITSVCVVSIDGTNYLTDGYIAIEDPS